LLPRDGRVVVKSFGSEEEPIVTLKGKIVLNQNDERFVDVVFNILETTNEDCISAETRQSGFGPVAG
jgi:hypothetical protein